MLRSTAISLQIGLLHSQLTHSSTLLLRRFGCSIYARPGVEGMRMKCIHGHGTKDCSTFINSKHCLLQFGIAIAAALPLKWEAESNITVLLKIRLSMSYHVSRFAEAQITLTIQNSRMPLTVTTASGTSCNMRTRYRLPSDPVRHIGSISSRPCIKAINDAHLYTECHGLVKTVFHACRVHCLTTS